LKAKRGSSESPCCHFSYATEHSYSSVQLGPQVNTHDTWYLNGDAIGSGNDIALQEFISISEGQLRRKLLTYVTTGYGQNISGGFHTTNALILDVEGPAGLKQLGKLLSAQRRNYSTVFSRVVSALVLRVKVVRQVFPMSKVGFYGSPNAPDSYAGEHYAEFTSGILQAAGNGLFASVDFLLPVLYFGANVSAPSHTLQIDGWSNRSLALAKEAAAMAERPELPIFIDTKFTYHNGGWLEPATIRRLMTLWRAVPTVSRIIYWFWPDDQLNTRGLPTVDAIEFWWARSSVIPMDCTRLSGVSPAGVPLAGRVNLKTDDLTAARVGTDGSLEVSSGKFVVSIATSFATEAGTNALPAADSWQVATTRIAPTAWRITADCEQFSLVRNVGVERWRVHVSDTITTGPERVGIKVVHVASIQGSDGRVLNATVPGQNMGGERGGFGCSNFNPGPEAPYHLHRGTFGNPTVHVQTLDGGVGLIPLNDIFELHAYANQSALARPFHVTAPLPNEPNHTACGVSNPPTLSLTDDMLVLPPAKEYTMEWGVYVSNNNSDYWSFINRVRSDIGATRQTISGSGYLAFDPPSGVWGGTETWLADAAYNETSWSNMTAATFRKLLDEQAIDVVAGSIPSVKRPSACSHNATVSLQCYGSCFVNELPEEGLRYLQHLRGLTRLADPRRPLVLYQHLAISTERNASHKYVDSRVTDAGGTQLTYHPCHMRDSSGVVHWLPGGELPMFFGTRNNSYGPELAAYYQKVLGPLEFDGLFHDEFCLTRGTYTFSEWDGYSGVLDPHSITVQEVMGELCFMTQHFEMYLTSLVLDAGGQMVYNGHPRTRTWREFAQRRRNGAPLLHFVENPLETQTFYTHLHTPMSLLTTARASYTGCRPDAYAPKAGNLSQCIGENVLAHLDHGVLPYLYDGLWVSQSVSHRRNIMQYMFPFTVTRIAKGMLEAEEGVITRYSGSVRLQRANSSSVIAVATFDADGLLVEETVQHGYVANVVLRDGGAAIVRLSSESAP
jgi:hypothetical protein